MTNREQTIADMRDNLVRLKALESHAKMFCNKETVYFVTYARMGIEKAIKEEEVNE